ncbi:hypothetical protein [Acinetobacter terrae]|uniref:Uncharacterized protein n=1 Tax=Acinetobacter terrae TaxID=2731247 RepID=A0A4R0EQQ9_9GAMM|nr:hypothetical protein [Acinetobacter terrae]TCB62219.1 hypothetical protein E0H85_01470 [Acinetobacter terrae]
MNDKPCTKCAGKNLDLLEYEAHKGKRSMETLASKEFQMKKGLFLMEVVKATYQNNESEVQKQASKKLLEIIRDL